MPAAIHPFRDTERSAAPGAVPLACIAAASQKGATAQRRRGHMLTITRYEPGSGPA